MDHASHAALNRLQRDFIIHSRHIEARCGSQNRIIGFVAKFSQSASGSNAANDHSTADTRSCEFVHPPRSHAVKFGVSANPPPLILERDSMAHQDLRCQALLFPQDCQEQVLCPNMPMAQSFSLLSPISQDPPALTAEQQTQIRGLRSFHLLTEKFAPELLQLLRELILNHRGSFPQDRKQEVLRLDTLRA